MFNMSPDKREKHQNAFETFRHHSDVLNGKKVDSDDDSDNSLDNKYNQASRLLGGGTIDVNQFSSDTNKLEYEDSRG